jgi:hypothetical protein
MNSAFSTILPRVSSPGAPAGWRPESAVSYWAFCSYTPDVRGDPEPALRGVESDCRTLVQPYESHVMITKL